MLRYALTLAALGAALPSALAADEVDVLGLASRLSTQPAALGKVLDQLAKGKEVVATKDEKQFIGTWHHGSTEYTFAEGGKGQGKFSDGKTFDIVWEYAGVGAYKNIPLEEGPHRGGAGRGPVLRWSFGDKLDDKAYKLGIYQLEGKNGKYTVMFPADGFFDGRDWYYKK